MKKWQDIAPPDDPNSWYDLSNMWPTRRGTYEPCDVNSTATNAYTATGETVGSNKYAFSGATLSSTRSYVIGVKIWQFAAGVTNRTGGVTVGSAPMMAQYGDVTLCVMGAANPTVKSTGGNFSALAGAPNGEIIVIQSNAVLIFNTNTSSDGWAASDVGDYTNWTTGEAASGRIIDEPGEITGAVAFGSDVLVFKSGAIYRMTYVGGVVKWQIQKVHKGLGMDAKSVGFSVKYCIAACDKCVIFVGSYDGLSVLSLYSYDGVGAPRKINEYLNALTGPVGYGVFRYDPVENRLAVQLRSDAAGGPVYFYSLDQDAWGRQAANASVGTAVSGDYFAASSAFSVQSSCPPIWKATTDTLTFYVPVTLSSVRQTSYLQTTLIGSPSEKTQFSRLTPILRRRVNGTAITAVPAAALSVEYFRERHDTTAASTQSVTESTQRKRFDFTGADNFARFKVTFTDIDAEVDDFAVATKSAGRE